MSADPRLLSESPLLPIAIVVAGVAATWYVTIVLDRRRRGSERREWRSLHREMRHHLRGRSSATRLERLATRAEPAALWTALERISLRLGRRALRRLAAALGRCPHVQRERRCLRDDSPWRRELAARRMGLLPSPASRRALRRALVAGPEIVTSAALRSLARAGDTAALRWWLDHPQALAGRSRRATRDLLEAFGRRGLPDISAALERGIEHPTLEVAAIDVLGQGGHRGARDRFEHLLEEGSLEQRIAAARALGALEAVECATPLLAALRDDAWQVRAQAARALGRTGAPVAVTALAAALTDRSWWVRRHSAYALGVLGPEGREALHRVVKTSPDPYAREMALEVLEGGMRFDAA